MVLEIIYNFRKRLATGNPETNHNMDYIKIVNLARIILIYTIQLLYDNSIYENIILDVKLNNNNIQKFLKIDKELDSSEDVHIQSKLLKLEDIRKNIKTNAPISKIVLKIRFEISV
jgi:hypothetical protein